MSIAQTQPAHPGPWAKWAPILRAHMRFIIIEAVLVAATLALVVAVMAHPGPLTGDAGITVWWQHLVRPNALFKNGLDEVSAINWPVPAAITAVVVTAVFALTRRWLDILVALGVLGLADMSNFVINQIVRRPRPSGYGVVVDRHIANVFSFPSGHVEHALAFLGIVVFLSFQMRRPAPWLTPWLWLVRIALLALIVLMSPSRVLQGEHWPSDGLAGLLWGGFWLLVGILVYTRAAQRWTRLVPMNERKEAPPRVA